MWKAAAAGRSLRSLARDYGVAHETIRSVLNTSKISSVVDSAIGDGLRGCFKTRVLRNAIQKPVSQTAWAAAGDAPGREDAPPIALPAPTSPRHRQHLVVGPCLRRGQ